MKIVTTHEQLRIAVADGSAKIDFHGSWRSRLQEEILPETLLNMFSWEKKVLAFLARPDQKQRFEDYYRDGIDVWGA